MKKTNITDVTKRIEELEDKHKSDKATFKKESETARAKLYELEAEREEAETPSEYKRLSELIREQKDYIDFLEHKETVLTAPTLSDDEFRVIQDALFGEVENLKDETAPKVYESLFPLLQIVEEYAQKIDVLNGFYSRAQSLAKKPVCPLDRSFADRYEDHYDWYKLFVRFCFDHHDEIARCKKQKDRLATITPWTDDIVTMKKYAED